MKSSWSICPVLCVPGDASSKQLPTRSNRVGSDVSLRLIKVWLKAGLTLLESVVDVRFEDLANLIESIIKATSLKKVLFGAFLGSHCWFSAVWRVPSAEDFAISCVSGEPVLPKESRRTVTRNKFSAATMYRFNQKKLKHVTGQVSLRA